MKALLIIYTCWTPQNSADLAQKNGWVMIESGIKNYGTDYLVETWWVNNKEIHVLYHHPFVGNKQNWCYVTESHD